MRRVELAISARQFAAEPLACLLSLQLLKLYPPRGSGAWGRARPDTLRCNPPALLVQEQILADALRLELPILAICFFKGLRWVLRGVQGLLLVELH